MDQEERRRMKPLNGVRILSVEQFAAGPYGTMFLAELGAEVIKIENTTGGDPSRYTGPHFLGEADGEYFHTWNMGKQSVTIDLKSDAGRAAFLALAAGADAVVNNLRGDQAKKLGLDYAALKAVNPALVCVHISAYGRNNERESWPGYDYLMQAESGLMSITGEPDGPPARYGASGIDYMTGMTGMVGLLSCLLSARQTGRGCDVDTCLFDVALHQLGYCGTWYLNHGDVTNRSKRSSHFSLAPVQTFPTADGWIFVMCMTQKFWISLVGALGLPDLADHPDYAAASARWANRWALSDLLDIEFRKHATAHWLEHLSGLLPVGPVYDLREALENPFVATTGMVRNAAHPANPEMRVLSNPLRIDGERPNAPLCSPLGAGNATLLPTSPEAAPVV
jgi:crotonobetainyl-CoA:carnitine CoA-transferase CaiB-like acyl-CoA transferase